MLALQKNSISNDSKIEWIGNVPKDWEILPVRAILNERKEKNFDGNIDNILSVMKDVGVIRYADKGNVGNKSSDRPENYKIVYKNDIVINSMNLVIGSVGLANEEGVTSSVYIIYHLKDKNNDIRYFYDLFRNKSFQRHLGTFGRGMMELRESVKATDIKNQLIPVPPIDLQKKIADFLDLKTKIIDRIIEKKKKLIELLKEKRISIITQAVTKGLDIKVKMKPSVVEWIREIPEGRDLKKVRYLLISHKQGYYTEESYVDDGYKLLRITDFNEYAQINTKNCPLVRKTNNIDEYLLKKGDFVFARTGGAGTFGYMNFDEEKLAFASYLIRFRFNDINNKDFFKWFFLSRSFLEGIKSRIHGGVNQNVHAEDIKEQYISLPNNKEQQKICYYLDSATNKIDKTVIKVKKQIECIEEYRSSLIYNAVTGKIRI